MISGICRLDPCRPPGAIAFATIATLLLVLPVASGCSKDSSSSTDPFAASDPVIARVNGVDIRQSDLTLAEEDVGDDMQSASPEAKREQLITYLADIILVTQAAEKKKLADSPGLQAPARLPAQQAADGLRPAGRSQERAHRRGHAPGLRGGGEVHGRPGRGARPPHPGGDRGRGQGDPGAIKGGADFATLAKEKSKDPGAADGGDLGYFTKEQMVPEFADVAFKMYPGQLSNPVKTQFGWHIIKLEDKRTKPVPEFEKVKDQIEAFLMRKAQTEYRRQAAPGRQDRAPRQGRRAEEELTTSSLKRLVRSCVGHSRL